MAFWIGFIIGAGAGYFLSALFIFPEDVLNIKLADMTIGDILRILMGLLVIPLAGFVVAKICTWFARAVVEFRSGIDPIQLAREARIEKYGKWGSDRYRDHLTDNDSEVKDGKNV